MAKYTVRAAGPRRRTGSKSNRYLEEGRGWDLKLRRHGDVYVFIEINITSTITRRVFKSKMPTFKLNFTISFRA